VYDNHLPDCEANIARLALFAQQTGGAAVFHYLTRDFMEKIHEMHSSKFLLYLSLSMKMTPYFRVLYVSN
jgi:hypothetical protein